MVIRAPQFLGTLEYVFRFILLLTFAYEKKSDPMYLKQNQNILTWMEFFPFGP